MSDPLTALMHAVQVMNLLKTLIMRTLREREESATGAYSPMSSHSSNQQTDEDFDSQQEMDISCESRGPASDYDDDDNVPYEHCSEDEDEVEVRSLGEIEECFLRQLDESNDSQNSLSEQPANDLRIECVESGNGDVSSEEIKNGNPGLRSSDVEDLGSSLTAVESKTDTESTSIGCASADDMEMMDSMDFISPMPLFAST